MKILNSNLELQAYINPIEALIDEQINRAFTFSFSTVLDDKSEHINHNNIVEIEDNYFNIVYFKKNRSNSLMIEADCEHVSYLLNDEEYDREFFTEDGTPLYILDKILEGTPLTVGTVEFTNVETFSIQEKMSRRALLVMFAEYVGGELLFEKYSISILVRRGTDNGVQFIVGKNIEGISKEVDNRKPINGLPKIAYDLDFVEISETEEYAEYKELETVRLGDTIEVIDRDLDIQVDQRIVSYSYNPIRKINSNVEIANFIEDLSDTIFKIQRTTVIKEKVYNGIRIGPENGFEAIRSDKKARTVMNATEGIKIQKGDGTGGYIDVIFLDTDGNAVFQGKIEASSFVGGSINIGDGQYTVDSNGHMISQSGEFIGTITGSIVTGTTINGGTITGALIQTSVDTFPRIELSSTSDVLVAEASAGKSIEIRASDSGNPVLFFSSALGVTLLFQSDDIYAINTTEKISMSGNNGVNISSLFGEVNIEKLIVNSGTEFDTLAQFNSTGATLGELTSDFNSLLAKLRSLNILA